MEKNYHVYVTINTPTGEFDQGCMANSLDEVMRDVLADHPSCTSVVMSVVRKQTKGGTDE